MSGIAQRWAVRNVARATFLDIETEKLLTYLENLKMSSINVSSETVYARGGDGNPKLIGFSSNKEVGAELISALFDNRALALLTGNDIVTGATDVYQREVLKLGTDKKATLSNTPKGGKLLVLYTMGADGVEDKELKLISGAEGDYTLTTDTIEYTAGAENDKLIAYYMITTTSTAQTITVSSDKFPAAFKLILEVLVTDFHTKKLYPAQITVPSARMEDDWSLSFAPEGEPEPMNLPIEMLKPADSNDIFTMKIYDNYKEIETP